MKMIHQYLIRVSEDEVAALEASGDIPAGLTSKRPLKFYMCMGCRKVWGALSILDEFFGTGHICAQPSVMHCNFASDGTIFFCPTKSVSLIKWMTAGLTCCSKQVFWKGPKYESARQHMASVMQACTWFHLLFLVGAGS
mmetsp:Transcript_58392/g.153746  ORF Transcript_58392/g.153746 Transcript_58392/m.153746 type:complete len:139 (+) Transcript_58392:2899-3315(+)